jgi:hypothetical protein
LNFWSAWDTYQNSVFKNKNKQTNMDRKRGRKRDGGKEGRVIGRKGKGQEIVW